MWTLNRKKKSILFDIDPVKRKTLTEITANVLRSGLSGGAAELRWRNIAQSDWYRPKEADYVISRLSEEELKLVYDIAFKKGVTPSTILTASIRE